MKLTKLWVAILVTSTCLTGFAQTNGLDFEEILGEFVTGNGMKSLLKSVPLQAAIGNEWSDAYIGSGEDEEESFHFGIGLSGGATFMPLNDLVGDTQTTLADILLGTTGVDVAGYFEPLAELGFPIPAYSVDLRFVLSKKVPLELGAKFGYLPFDFSEYTGQIGLKLDYLMAGGDLRYALLRSKGLLVPDLIIGLGYTYINTAISFQPTLELLGQFATRNENDYPKASFAFGSHTAEAKVQAGWRLLFLEPFIGFSVMYSAATVSLETSGKLVHARFVDLSGYSKEVSDDAIIGLRAYGGIGLKLFWFHLDFGGSYEIMNNAWTAYSGLRFQL